MKQVQIVCDGSSLGNGGRAPRAGAVAILEHNGNLKIVGEFLGNATNQQAEIIAACLGLETLNQPCQAEVVSDSQYVVKTMNKLFKRKTNHEFWERLDKAANGHRITWTWTRGHAGHPIQEKCDEAARLIATTGEVDESKLAEILAA